MPNLPFISICIPAYRRVELMRRLLESVRIQDFSDFEVVVTDDSPDATIEKLCNEFADEFPLVYLRNPQALGTPENWNEAIRIAKGQWIKLMHDDDFFARPDSLSRFASTAHENPEGFVFSSYQNIRISQKLDIVHCSKFRLRQLLQTPASLLSKNCIGPPSVIMHRKYPGLVYDRSLKWLVDMDFYMRLIKVARPVYVKEVLVNIGLNPEQVTNSSSLVREVEIPEHFAVLNKVGIEMFQNILVYDAWWRLFRNLQIRDVSEIRAAGYQGEIPSVLIKMLRFQTRFPPTVLRIGAISKVLMSISYRSNY